MKITIPYLINTAIEELNHTLSDKIPSSPDTESGEIHLFGGQGLLDSIALVTLILKIEEKIEEAYGINLTLADEKAFSQAQSPFRTLLTLTIYVESRFDELRGSNQ